MCGIAGTAFSKKSNRIIDIGVLTRMRDAQFHRGPDEADGFVAENIGLAHRRLSIVDVRCGRQPMTNEDGSLQIVFNGEIYNHNDYREDLIARGHVYKTTSDTETILHLYEEYGAACVDHLRGMFGFAIWDANKQELFVARDRLGVKPLYFVYDAEGSLFFASEIKSLLHEEIARPELNYRVLPEQFANHGTNGEETLFKNVRRLLPGHFLIWRDGEIEVKKYWDVSFEPKIENQNDGDLIMEWRELFRESVEMRLMADVPLGMFLSGGIDSSAILANMATMTDAPVKTFSVAFDNKNANELGFARIVAEKFRTDHHEVTVSAKEFFDSLPRLIWYQDEPLPFDACVPLYFVSKLAQNHVKVVLTGEGSDEILGGYGRYHKTLINLAYGEKYERATPRAMRGLVRAGRHLLPAKMKQKFNRSFLSLAANLDDLYFNNFAIFRHAELNQLFAAEARELIGESHPFGTAHGFLAGSDAANTLDKMLFVDTKTYLHELLMKQDRMSMAASIESRVPFLDYKLVEFTARLPEKLKIRNGTTKWILREAMRGVLPDEILTRPKMGFPVPLDDWLRGEFRFITADYILSERVAARRIFNSAYLHKIVTEHAAGNSAHTAKLWSLINFELWARQFLDGETI